MAELLYFLPYLRSHCTGEWKILPYSGHVLWRCAGCRATFPDCTWVREAATRENWSGAHSNNSGGRPSWIIGTVSGPWILLSSGRRAGYSELQAPMDGLEQESTRAAIVGQPQYPRTCATVRVDARSVSARWALRSG